MIDRDHILLPVNPAFIGFSLVAAFFMNLFPWGGWGWVPDFVALTLIFWSIYQPRKVGIGIAFLMGLVMDVHSASLLGENALAYTLLSYFAITIHRRVLWFTFTRRDANCTNADTAGSDRQISRLVVFRTKYRRHHHLASCLLVITSAAETSRGSR